MRVGVGDVLSLHKRVGLCCLRPQWWAAMRAASDQDMNCPARRGAKWFARASSSGSSPPVFGASPSSMFAEPVQRGDPQRLRRHDEDVRVRQTSLPEQRQLPPAWHRLQNRLKHWGGAFSTKLQQFQEGSKTQYIEVQFASLSGTAGIALSPSENASVLPEQAGMSHRIKKTNIFV